VSDEKCVSTIHVDNKLRTKLHLCHWDWPIGAIYIDTRKKSIVERVGLLFHCKGPSTTLQGIAHYTWDTGRQVAFSKHTSLVYVLY